MRSAISTLQEPCQQLITSSGSISYEVIFIRRREGFQIGARFVEPAEVSPNSEAWGMDGFTLTDKDIAFAKLRELA